MESPFGLFVAPQTQELGHTARESIGICVQASFFQEFGLTPIYF